MKKGRIVAEDWSVNEFKNGNLNHCIIYWDWLTQEEEQRLFKSVYDSVCATIDRLKIANVDYGKLEKDIRSIIPMGSRIIHLKRKE